MRKLLFFHQANCPPCDAAKPKVEAVIQELGDALEHRMVDLTPGTFTQEEVDLVQKYRVKFTPTAVAVDENGDRKGSLFGGFISPTNLKSILQA